ncbi:PQQ-dependent sugar dehydrogenase [Sneathiella marina]|uniref:PQQ-dependent sugar dehydrogenase n=1 Tax=Sneathiella marina TaxID=2950108 RepID=A0ABY4W0V3_9PROT|nr:PQQ-dependent sugar dehydrogenase [Sneathiella marina]USG60830.1 PQQ-dependent sugar dehydrogenase [Sneathiella marina]
MSILSKLLILICISVSSIWSSAAFAQSGLPSDSDIVGEEFTIKAGDLPKPYATPVEALPPRIWNSNEEGDLNLPPNFKVKAYRSELTHARWLEVLKNGDVLVAEPRAGEITLLRDTNGDGVADMKTELVSNLDRPHGMAVVGDWLYIGEPKQIRRVRFSVGDTKATGRIENVTEQGSLGDGGGHWTRNLLYDEGDHALYISIGSAANMDIEPSPRATIQKLDLSTNKLETVASGLRNPVGIDFDPVTGKLYTVVNERDGYGDGLVPDYLTHVIQDGFYGWPYAYSGTIPDPDYADDAPEMVSKSLLPDVLFRSHSAPLGLIFYNSDQFPKEYLNDAFVAFHGSWNASVPTGYKIVRVPFENGKPAGSYENFATGFRTNATDDGAAKVWGRPVGLAIATDGALLVADDVSQTVWRISYAE